jgi:hypothetical protein
MKSKPKSPVAPAARRALAQVDRFAAALDDAVAQHAAEPRTRTGHFLYKADGRTPMFYLQGMARVSQATGPDRQLWRTWLPRFKEVEDRIGAYDYWFDLQHRGHAWKLPKPMLAYFGERAEQAMGALEYALQRAGWWVEHEGAPTGPGPMLAELRTALTALGGRKPKKERKQIAAFLRDEVTEIIDKLADGRIDLDEVELGIHELRRHLRWLPIYGLALGGKIVLDPATHDGPLAHYLTPDRLNNRFNQLPGHDDEPEPVQLDTGAFLAVSLLIAEIGKLKDRALFTQEIERSSRLLGLDADKTATLLGEERIAHGEVVAGVRELVRQVIDGDAVLQRLADHLAAQT